MAGTIGIGIQDFGRLIEKNCFYVDKTQFIKEWWESEDAVTLLTRPRRFGKTLAISMMEHFFSLKYAGQKKLFEKLDIWQEDTYRRLQGTYPVISLSFANVKECRYQDTYRKICQILTNLYQEHAGILQSPALSEKDRMFFEQVTPQMDSVTAAMALHQLSRFLYLVYQKRVIILLDEYDTPMQEAYLAGYWEELVCFSRSLFHAAFKTNPYLERALLTGITRISRESVFSDLNNLAAVTVTSEEYKDAFGFLEEEVFQALDEYGLSDKKQAVKSWYDGFIFGSRKDIYNPWSVIHFLKTGRLRTYWANSSSNALISRLIWEGSTGLKTDFEALLYDRPVKKQIDEQIVFSQLFHQERAIWSLMLACGYLRAECVELDEASGQEIYTLKLTNKEVQIMFADIFRGWFLKEEHVYNKFIQSLLCGDIEGMNWYINQMASSVFSFHDTGNGPSDKSEPEKFYHGFVLGLIAELSGTCCISSNRESGLGRYDVMIEPLQKNMDAVLIEFKVFDYRQEHTLEDTVIRALEQIEAKHYDTVLLAKGFPPERIKKYGFAFHGRRVLIGQYAEKNRELV